MCTKVEAARGRAESTRAVRPTRMRRAMRRPPSVYDINRCVRDADAALRRPLWALESVRSTSATARRRRHLGRRRHRVLELELVEAVVDAAPGEELLVGAQLPHLALVQHQDAVGA